MTRFHRKPPSREKIASVERMIAEPVGSPSSFCPTACKVKPMLMDTSGNAGNQVSTLMIRGLALGEIKIKDYFKVLFKEFRVGIICAAVLVALNFGRMYIMHSGDVAQYLIVSAALFIAIMIANAIGCTLPILMKLIHLDPALMAGPMMTTILDVTTLAVYFFIAQKVLL